MLIKHRPSYYFIAILAAGNLLSMVWVPYVMNYLKAPDYLAVAMFLAGTLASVVASLFWKGRSFKTLRSGLLLNVAAPALVLATPITIIHPLLQAFASFMYTGANLIGIFLFAQYNRWLGAIRSSILLVIILNLAQTLIAPIGFLIADYFLLFSIVIVVKLAALTLALLTIPEVTAVPEETARTYSFLLYSNSVLGYRVSVELSKDTIMTTLRLIGLAVMFLVLYIIYRTLFTMIS